MPLGQDVRVELAEEGCYFMYIFEEKLEPHVVLPGCAASG